MIDERLIEFVINDTRLEDASPFYVEVQKIFRAFVALREASTTYLLMNDDDGTVTLLTMCNHCRYLVADIDKHVRVTVSVPGSSHD